MIHLRAENWSSLGDDTFWCWAEREFPGVKADREPVQDSDVVLHYGLLGEPKADADKTVALLWEQHQEMAREVGKLCGQNWHAEIARLNAAYRACARRVVASHVMAADYKNVDVLPIGVDTDLWRPPEPGEKNDIRDKYDIPHGIRLGFWAGHDHPMKGYDLFRNHAKGWWVQVFKRRPIANDLSGIVRASIPQPEIAELMRMCDFALFTSRLRPFCMLEWEAMSTNLPVVNIGHNKREFVPSDNPRQDVFDRCWDRHSAKEIWLSYL